MLRHATSAILVLAGFVGFAVISKVPNTLHTPLMSGTNAIHGIVVLGGILVLGLGERRLRSRKLLLVIAITFGTINVVGGFLVTDRMLEMFKAQARSRRGRAGEDGSRDPRPSFLQDQNFIDVLYIVAFALFIYGLMGLTGPRTAVRGNRIAAVGMAIAVVATLLIPGIGNWGLIILGVAHRHGGRRPGGAPGEDDRDAADGRAVQRRRRRRGRADRVGRSSATPAASTGDADLRRDLQRCSPRSSARSRSGARTSRSPSSRRSCPAGRSALGRGAAAASTSRCSRSRVACAVAIAAGSDERAADDRPAGRRGGARATSSCCRSAARTCRS